MSQPPQFLRQHNFTDFSSANPTTQQSGVWLDDELNAAKVTLDALGENIAEIQRDDGALFNGIVTYDSLSSAVKALLGTNVNPRGDWVTATSYAKMDMVTHPGATYLCATAHTSGTFATDLAAFKWLLFAGTASTGDMSGLDFSTIAEDTTPDLSSDYVLTRDTSASANKKVKPINLLSPTSPVYVPTVGGTANAITLTPTTAIAAYAAGQRFRFIVGSDNTSGTVTAAVSGLLTKSVKKVIGKTIVSLAPGDMPSGSLADIEYDGTQFELMSARPYSQGANIASAPTLDLTGSTGDYIHIAGVTTITAVTLEQGQERTLVFDGVLTLINSASMILPGGANITTAAGDVATVRGEASSVVRFTSYTKASGQAVVAPVAVTDQTIAVTDNATNNVSNSAHGFAPKAPNDATKYLDGTGAYSVPGGSKVVLLATATASASSTLDFSSQFDTSLYTHYFFVISELLTSTSSSVGLEYTANNGGAWAGTGWKSQKVALTLGGTTAPTYTGVSAATPVLLTTSVNATSWTGLINVCLGLGMADSSWIKSYLGDGGLSSISYETTIILADNGVGGTSGGFRFLPSAGNFTSGKIYCYGVKNT